MSDISPTASSGGGSSSSISSSSSSAASGLFANNFWVRSCGCGCLLVFFMWLVPLVIDSMSFVDADLLILVELH